MKKERGKQSEKNDKKNVIEMGEKKGERWVEKI